MLLVATALGFVGAVPLFWLMHHTHAVPVLLGQLGFVLAVGMFLGTQPSVMVEAVPARVRCTAIALGYNVTLGVVGGLSPLVATWLVQRTENDLSPAFMVMAAAVISFLAVLGFKETNEATLEIVPVGT
jgi:MHS family proline/betaine transporter-like MFS transporter